MKTTFYCFVLLFVSGLFSFNALHAQVTGTMGVCIGSTTMLDDATTGGHWASSNNAAATVGSGTGIVAGVAAGTTLISYTITGGTTSTATVTVYALPQAISGTASVCTGATITLTDVTTGGTWSTTSGNASLGTSSTGVVTGVSAGTAIITYTSIAGCIKTSTVTINQSPAVITVGASAICVAATTGLSDAVSGGLWTSSATAAATIATTGIVTGVAAGTTTISYTLGSCRSTAVITVDAIPAAISGTASVCTGLTTTLTDVTAGGTWSTSSSAASLGTSSSGVLTGVSAGTVVITYKLSTGCYKTSVATVNQSPAVITVGASAICVAATTGLSDAVSGGLWTSSATAAATIAATGIVTGVAAGTTTISYTLGSCRSTAAITVDVVPAAISGTASVCTGLTTTLTDVTAGGTWSTSSSAASLGTSSSGVLTGVSAGTVIITYKLSTGCYKTSVATVNRSPAAITVGASAICVAATTGLSDAVSGGLWTSSATAAATIAATGIVTGVAAGTTTISYTLSSCRSTAVITVDAVPAAISGTASVCTGLTTTLTDVAAGGTWSTSSSAASLGTSSSGVLTGVSAGTVIITYKLSTGCYKTSVATVNQSPAAITVGASAICVAATTGLSDAVSGGLWTSSATAAATIAATGIVTGAAAGTTTISYTLGSCRSTAVITVDAVPAAISGTASVCTGLTTTLTDVTAGGTWSTSSSAASLGTSSSGVLTGVSAGTVIITYKLSTGCYKTSVATVNQAPAAITVVAGAICITTTANLVDGTSGGIWSSSSTAVATIATTGIVTGVAAGITTISYTLGSCRATTVITVNSLPGPITGTASVCTGLTTTLTNVTIGGTWSAASGTASIGTSSTGVLTGVSAGTSVISYILPTGCYKTDIVTVNQSPTAIMGGGSILCSGPTTLSDIVTGGTWATSSATIAPIGASSGIVTVGATSGTATISYTLPGGCKVSAIVTVSPVQAMLGSPITCIGSLITLSDATTGGVWSSNNTAIASVGSGTGVVTGVGSGVAGITYSNAATGCSSIVTVTVNGAPATIYGSGNICLSHAITLTDATAGGTWSTSNAVVATVGTSGIVTGVASGTANITYSLGSGCKGIIMATVNPNPASITGPASVCIGSTITMSDATSGGAWSNTGIAGSVDAYGNIAGLSAGTSTVIYQTPAGCTSSHTVTAYPIPSPILGVTTLCNAGSISSLSDATTGSIGWSSSNTSIATINNGGVVTAVALGAVTVTYTVSTGCSITTVVTVGATPSPINGNTPLCVYASNSLSDNAGAGIWQSSYPVAATIGSATGIVTGNAGGTATITFIAGINGCVSTAIVTVNPILPILGTAKTCIGGSTSLSDIAAGGVWSSDNTSVITIGTNGFASGGPGSGIANITYLIPATGCSSTIAVTVNPLAATIYGTSTLCAGYPQQLSDAATGGIWSSANVVIATVDTNGNVTPVNAGNINITYTTSTGCTGITNMTINPSPEVVAGQYNYTCVGYTLPFSDATAGGVWSSSDTTVGTVDSFGNVYFADTGVFNVIYQLSTGCTAIGVITVNPDPSPILGNLIICVGAVTTLSDTTPPSHYWKSTDSAVAMIARGNGILTGLSAGTSLITYDINDHCRAFAVVTVNPAPSAIFNNAPICPGGSVTLADTTSTGTWSSNNTALATVDSVLGIVAGVSGGTTTVTYWNTPYCTVTAVVTVNPLLPINGPPSVCSGSSITLNDGTTGGAWSSGNISSASIDPVMGIVTGGFVGIVNITYSITATGCATTYAVTVDSLAPMISGQQSICIGSTSTLSDATSGGTWSSSTTLIATIGSTGVVSGINTGTSRITYSFGGCSTIAAVSVNPNPSVISGAGAVCPGTATTLTDAIGGGAWSDVGAAGSIGPISGVVTGLSAGTITVSYILPTSCYATRTITTNPLPSSISGTAAVCAGGSTTTLSDGTTGSIGWSSSNTGFATVLNSGVVTGVAAGTTYITYKISTGCYATTLVTVNALPNAAIYGPATVSLSGGPVTLTDATTGGTWVSSHASVATIGSSTGVVTAVASAGSTTISYTVSSLGCNATGTFLIMASPAPPHSGGSATGGTITMNVGDAVVVAADMADGTWGSSNTGVATVDGNGIVTAVSPGAVNITHVAGNGNGMATTMIIPVSVNSQPIDVRVVPNPNNGTFIIMGTLGAYNNEEVALEITDVLGQAVYKSKIMSQKGILNEPVQLNNGLASGMYMLNVTSATEQKTFHFVIEK